MYSTCVRSMELHASEILTRATDSLYHRDPTPAVNPRADVLNMYEEYGTACIRDIDQSNRQLEPP